MGMSHKISSPLLVHAFPQFYIVSRISPICFHTCPCIPPHFNILARVPTHYHAFVRNRLIDALSHVFPYITTRSFAFPSFSHRFPQSRTHSHTVPHVSTHSHTFPHTIPDMPKHSYKRARIPAHCNTFATHSNAAPPPATPPLPRPGRGP